MKHKVYVFAVLSTNKKALEKLRNLVKNEVKKAPKGTLFLASAIEDEQAILDKGSVEAKPQ